MTHESTDCFLRLVKKLIDIGIQTHENARVAALLAWEKGHHEVLPDYYFIFSFSDDDYRWCLSYEMLYESYEML